MKREEFTESDLLRRLIDASVDGLLAFDRECRYTAWNSAMERISGMRRDEVVGRSAFEVFPFLLETGEDRFFHEALAGRTAVAEARPYTIPETGRRGLFDGYYSPLRDASGRIAGGVAIIRDITASREAQEALRVSEERYRAFIGNSSEGIWRFELEAPVPVRLPADEQIELFYRDGYLAECNDAMARMYGYESAGELAGARLGDLLVREDPNNFEYLRAFIDADYRLTDAESVESDREGRPLFFSNNLVGVVKDGHLLRAWGTQRDVTERKRIEDELRATERRFFMFMENLPGLAWIKTVEGRYVYANEAAARAFGVARDELRGRADEELFPAETAAQFRENDRQALLSESGVLTTVETLEQPDGLHHSIVSKFRIPAAADAPPLVGGMAIDVTDRMRAEEAIRESVRRLRLVADHAPVLITYCGADRNYRFTNLPYAERFGMLPEDLVGRPYREVMGAEASDAIEPYVEAVLRGERVEFETEIPYQGIGARHMWVAYAPEFDDAGRVTGFVSAILDITERKRAEAALREAESRAEAEREHLLEREQELRARAEEANRLKDEFLATISHELRTPLTAILGWSSMLRTNDFDEAARTRALEIIERNAKNQKQIIEDLLDASRIITGKLRLDVRPVELASLIEASVESFLPAAEAKGVRLQKELDVGLSPVVGDPARLQQVVWNLLSNAIKFTPGGGRVRVRLAQRDSHVELGVSDTGQGISPEFLPYVFDRFRQADSTTTRRHGGLGLGLAIVRHLVELHGGTVRAESDGPGAGSNFTVSLPLAPGGGSDERPETKRPGAGDGPLKFDCAERFDGLKVLVVDDEADTCELLRAALGECGAQVATARSAREALAQIGRFLPDVLISDIGMPGEDGYDLIRRVRELPAESGGATPAVALTAYAGAEDRLRVLRAGYQMHLPKPVELAELVAVVASLVKRPKPS